MMRRVLLVLAAAGVALWTASPAQAKSCADFDSQAEAQRYLRAHPQDPDKLDPDNNGVACENAPSPQDYVPVRHVDSSGSTIPLEQDSPTTRPPGGTTSTSLRSGDDTTTTFDDVAPPSTESDTTDETLSVTQHGDGSGVSTLGVVATLVGVVVFGGLYVWYRRR